MLSAIERQDDNSLQVIPDNWNAGGNKFSGASCSSPLLCLTGFKDRRTSLPPLIRVCSDSELLEFCGPAMVDYSPKRAQWETNLDGSPRSDN